VGRAYDELVDFVDVDESDFLLDDEPFDDDDPFDPDFELDDESEEPDPLELSLLVSERLSDLDELVELLLPVRLSFL
jgi:hypothetical protein